MKTAARLNNNEAANGFITLILLLQKTKKEKEQKLPGMKAISLKPIRRNFP
jgi:hypothetical protein